MLRSLAVLLLWLVCSHSLAQPSISLGPGYIYNDAISKPLVGLTGAYRIGRVVPNVIASWSDPWGWEPNIVRAKVGYAFLRHERGAVLLEAGADALRLGDSYHLLGAATVSSVCRLGERGRWVLAGTYRPESDSWAVITRLNLVLWSGK